jgi:hypothetical protein
MTKHHPNHNPFKEVKFISLFVSPKNAYEIERPSSTSLKRKSCPSGHQRVVLDNGRDSTLIPPDLSLENENFYAMDISLSTTCLYGNLLLIFVHKLFKRIVVDAFVYNKHYESCSGTMVLTLQLEHNTQCFGSEARNYTNFDSYKMKFSWSSL